MPLNEILKNLLLSVSQNVYLYTAQDNPQIPYIIYGIDGDNNLFAGNRRGEIAQSGYIDLFTKDVADSLIFNIPAALDSAEVSFYLNSVQYEEETSLLHYEWRWECA